MRFNFSYQLIILVLVFIFSGCSNNQLEEYGFASADVYSSEGARLTEGPMPAPAMAPAPPMVAPRVSSDSITKIENKSSISSAQIVDKENRSWKMQMQSSVDQEVAQLISSDRIIVRTVNMGIDVENVANALISFVLPSRYAFMLPLRPNHAFQWKPKEM